MIKGFKVTIKERPELSGLWRVEVIKRTGIVQVAKPEQLFRKIAPGYNGKYNQYYKGLDDSEKTVIQRLLKEFPVLQEDYNG